ncbi:MAG: hypothetical protein HN703_03770 [Planctomycetaceae bacterium]|nr:hypothetical protein [Planctomycetaceae bacterium]
MPTQKPISSDDIAHLVTEVLRRIRTETKPQVSTQEQVSTQGQVSTDKQNTPTATLADRVVAAKTIVNLARGTKVAYIVDKAVITPSARDIARDRGIELITAQSKPQQPSDRQLILAQADCKRNVSGATGAVRRAVPASQQLPTAGLVTTLEALADHTGRDAARCILFSENTVVACIAANRFSSIRAVTATDSTTLKTSSAACAANILILDPRDFSVGSLTQIAKSFAHHPAENTPQILTTSQPRKDRRSCSCTDS